MFQNGCKNKLKLHFRHRVSQWREIVAESKLNNDFHTWKVLLVIIIYDDKDDDGGSYDQGSLSLQGSDAVAILSANGSAAFNESCAPIG